MIDYYGKCFPKGDINTYIEESLALIDELTKTYKTVLYNFNNLEKSALKFVQDNAKLKKKIQELEETLNAKH